MNIVHFKGVPCHTTGNLPAIKSKAPAFNLVSSELKTIDDRDYRNKRLILNIFPSLDTDVCATSVRRFNAEAASLPNTQVICVSMDLPFAARRFCTTEGIDNLIVASAFRSTSFAQKYGVGLADGPLAGLLARAVFVMDEGFHVLYAQLVDEITQEPDYEAALKALKSK